MTAAIATTSLALAAAASSAAGGGGDDPAPPAVLPLPFAAPSAEGLDCSWTHRPDGFVSLLVAADARTSAGHVLREAVLKVAPGSNASAPVTWGEPTAGVPLPTVNGSRFTTPRGAVVPIVDEGRGTPSSSAPGYKFVGLSSVYPVGTARLDAVWSAANASWVWAPGGLVWAGVNGGGIRNIAVVDRPPPSSLPSLSRPSASASASAPAGLFAAHQANRAPGGVPVPSNVTALLSTHDGADWPWAPIASHVTAPVPPGSSCYGAVEPTSVQLPNGTLWVLFRTQTGRLWQTVSDNGGATLAPGSPSRFRSTDTPPLLMRLDHSRWGSNGAILLVWVNCGTSIALPCADRANSIYTVRNLLHAAVSTDGGATFRGFREVYRDPLMAATPPSRGDIGVAYSYGAELPDGTVVFKTGQGAGRWAVVRIDPGWLLATSTRADFASPSAASTWNDPRALGSPHYVTTCLYYRHFGAAVPDPPRCDGGGVGVDLLPQDGGGGSALCLSMSMHGANTTQASAAYNFPAAASGTATLTLRAGPGFAGANVSLADHYVPSFDARADDSALFVLRLEPADLPSTWATLTLEWSVAKATCVVSVGGKALATLPMQQAGNVAGMASYLRLTAARPGPSLRRALPPARRDGRQPADVDGADGGFCVRTIDVVGA